jgi:hypothetical protein
LLNLRGVGSTDTVVFNLENICSLARMLRGNKHVERKKERIIFLFR